ncbi:Transport protein particle (TRAPP) component [Corchorus olitorius]|uniref:Transport protein particle (TRAPP) component n=1 Tax=Corchorus olitorius TaxID=93759 RepID=A0A1R3GBB5_9ROSI|nr:Transport protein particle (TRAPP) component [Corchorus olitorius]
MGREVSESCIDSLLTEMVSTYCNRFYANKPELAARRIEAIGYQVGHQLSERKLSIPYRRDAVWILGERMLVVGFYNQEVFAFVVLLGIAVIVISGVPFKCDRMYTMERPRFSDHLEAIKFICKDFWSELFKKQIDNLKTNHRGTFVLQDNRFRWLTRMSIDQSPENGASEEPSIMADNKAVQSMHLYFPCGIIRGALSNLGIPCAVSADISNLPACSFVVRIKA